ncbi:5-dehydro-4-deoxyglucarate dehydratase [Streptomyces sp. NPDC002817]|uniref:5-dehydro-4-deoxyglucarate dehydratase n=1 Tax=Streptomyces sp. NPDC088357 TaxID=3154655 RepID=UPI003430DAC2
MQTTRDIERDRHTADRLRKGMAQGVLSFPLTSFDAEGGLDLDGFRSHLTAQLAAGPGAVFVACGTGEFFSLSAEEYHAVVRTAVDVVAGQVPVVAGVGYGWSLGLQFARLAEEAGADAGLLMPHYLISAPQRGYVDHVRAVAGGSPLPLIVYQRGQVKLTTAAVRELATVDGVVGLKDGHGDLDQMQRLRLVAPGDWLFFNGVATAEMQARAYASIGIPAYSSAVHAFAPEIAGAFYTAHRAGDHPRTEQLLREFYLPLVELRDQGTGYAVSLVKAAARLRGAPVGPVRAPLMEPAPDHLGQLEALLHTGLELATDR